MPLPWRSALIALVLTWPVSAQVPQPFPRPQNPAPRQPSAPAPPAPARPSEQKPAEQPAATAVPTEETLGVPIYPGAQYLTSYDAGRGQRFYLFGAGVSFAELVSYYRTALKAKGELVFEVPPTHMFEIGRFREETMAFPPSVTLKDYTWSGSGGYLNPKRGATPERFPTVIQIVPPPAGAKP
jgi:hypothetical protein